VIIVTAVVAERRRNATIAPDEMAHPLRGGVAKPRIFPQWGDCRVTEQVDCPVTGPGACGIASSDGIHAVTAVRGYIAMDRLTRYCAVAATRSKGGRQHKNKI
jgi:hypothetical protein